MLSNCFEWEDLSTKDRQGVHREIVSILPQLAQNQRTCLSLWQPFSGEVWLLWFSPSLLPSFRTCAVGAELWWGLTELFLTGLNWRNVEARWRWQPQEQLLHVRTCPVSKGYGSEIFLRGLVIDTGMLLWNKGKTQQFKPIPLRLSNIPHVFWLKSDNPWSSV